MLHTAGEQSEPPRDDADLDRLSALFLEAARTHDARFVATFTGTGLELQRFSGPEGPQGRAFLKLCRVRPAHTVVFFFKRSLLPFSRDRYSYGGCEWPDAHVVPQLARESLDFLASGLSAAARPPWLRRSLPFSLPD